MKKKLLALLAAMLLICMAAAAVLAVYVWAAAEKRAVLRPHSPSVCLKDRQNRYLDDIANPEGELGYWKADIGIPAYAVDAFLAAEDRDFYRHNGVDWKAAARALRQNLLGRKRISGASTIAMQVVRMEKPAPRNYLNKLIEAAAALRLVKKYGREQVLAHYLCIAPFGNRIHGVAFACERYLDKPLCDITLAEACLLAALPRAPSRYQMYDPAGRYLALTRARWILGRMLALSMIDGKTHSLALESLSRLPFLPAPSRPEPAIHAILRMRHDPAITGSPSQLVKTTLDLDLQEKVARALSRIVEQKRKQGARNASAIVADRATGEILTYAGSTGYFDVTNSGGIDFADTPRASGSILKPFLYAFGMMSKGFDSSTVLSDIGLLIANKGSLYRPDNSDHAFEGPILYRYALANSRNIPAIQVLNSCGIQPVFDFYRRLGLVGNEHPADWYGLSLAVGGLYVRLFDLVRAYGILANDGAPFSLSFVSPPPATNKGLQKARLIPSDIARMIAIYLSDPSARLPTFPRMGSLEYPFPVAVKTGTSFGYRDAWTLAFTERYVVGVWLGDPDNARMDGLGGANTAALAMRKILGWLHPRDMEGFRDLRFQPPQGYAARRICMADGKLSDENTPSTVTEYFSTNRLPTEKSDLLRPVTVDRRTGNYPSPDCPGRFLETRLFAYLPPKYADWAKENGWDLPPARPDLIGRQEPGDPSAASAVITEPADGSRFLIDPTLPRESQTIGLRGTLEPENGQALWYVDGRPYRVVDHPYTIRWKLVEGPHRFQLRFPYSPVVSKEIRIQVD